MFRILLAITIRPAAASMYAVNTVKQRVGEEVCAVTKDLLHLVLSWLLHYNMDCPWLQVRVTFMVGKQGSLLFMLLWVNGLFSFIEGRRGKSTGEGSETLSIVFLNFISGQLVIAMVEVRVCSWIHCRPSLRVFYSSSRSDCHCILPPPSPQLIPGVSSVPFYSTLVPLIGVLGTTAVKDAYDDIVSPIPLVQNIMCMYMYVCRYVCRGVDHIGPYVSYFVTCTHDLWAVLVHIRNYRNP